MKEHPIIFSTPMVESIIAGQKTQTRRILQLPAWSTQELKHVVPLGCHPPQTINRKTGRFQSIKSPYGQVGDHLYVRETFNPGSPETGTGPFFKAGASEFDRYTLRWKPCIHMPKQIARIWLKIEEIRIERLQDISEEDAMAEGIRPLFTQEEINRTVGISGFPQDHGWTNYLWHGHSDISPSQADAWPYQYSGYDSAKESFSSLWEKINAKPRAHRSAGEITHYISYPWADIQEIREHRGKPWHILGNPWVWVVSFSRFNH